VPSVFLSHSRRDAEVARRLHARLDAEGISTWLDQKELLPGDSLIGKIQQAIAEFDYLAVLLSPASVTSSWVTTEVQAALNQEIEHRRVKVIPILVESCQVPLFLRDKLYVDLTQDFEAGVALLLRRLNPRPEEAEARRLFSHGYGRWSRSGQADRHLIEREDLEAVLGHLDLSALSPPELTYLIRSAVSALATAVAKVAPLAPLSRRLGDATAEDLRREFTPLFEHEHLHLRIAAARLLATAGGGAAADLLLELIRRERLGAVRDALLEQYEKQHGMTEAVARSILDSDESDWRVISRAFRFVPGIAAALVISDRTDFASELCSLARSAGYLVVTVSRVQVLELVQDPRALPLFSLLVLVRGEDYGDTILRPLYSRIAEFVDRGGDLLATPWAAWEANQDPGMEAVSPVVLLDRSHVEGETRVIRTGEGEELSVRGSFERLGLREGAEARATFRDGGDPLLAVRRVGQGRSIYLNICQHSCGDPVASPLRHAPRLAEVIGSTLRGLRSRTAT